MYSTQLDNYWQCIKCIQIPMNPSMGKPAGNKNHSSSVTLSPYICITEKFEHIMMQSNKVRLQYKELCFRSLSQIWYHLVEACLQYPSTNAAWKRNIASIIPSILHLLLSIPILVRCQNYLGHIKKNTHKTGQDYIAEW